MNPIQNLVLRAARQVNEYIIQVIDSREPGTSSDEKSLSHLESTLFQTLFDNLKPGYPEHYVAEPGESTESVQKEHIWSVQGFDRDQEFVRRMPTCTYAISHRQNGKTIDGLVLNPFTGEEFAASRGNGASLNSRRIRCTKTSALANHHLATNLVTHPFKDEALGASIELLTQLKDQGIKLVSFDNVTLNAAMVASGQVDAALLCHVSPRDLEAILLICQESGALVGTLGGDIIKDQRDCHLVVANPKLYKTLIQTYCQFDSQL